MSQGCPSWYGLVVLPECGIYALTSHTEMYAECRKELLRNLFDQLVYIFLNLFSDENSHMGFANFYANRKQHFLHWNLQ